jgi:hypothetical protein
VYKRQGIGSMIAVLALKNGFHGAQEKQPHLQANESHQQLHLFLAKATVLIHGMGI